jgi:hypothetical protein
MLTTTDQFQQLMENTVNDSIAQRRSQRIAKANTRRYDATERGDLGVVFRKI